MADDQQIKVEPIQEDEYETLLELLLEADNYLAGVVDDDTLLPNER